MAYNTNRTTPTIRGLANSGADLLKHMYDVKIYFPNPSTGAPEESPFNQYPITVRASGFTTPEFAIKTYPVSYHGITINRPAAAFEGERSFELTFREDAAFELRKRFSAWFALNGGDPVTGAVGNAVQYFGQVEVGTVSGQYSAVEMSDPNGTGKKTDGTDIVDSNGHITSRHTGNPIAMWAFYNVWLSKVGGVDFSTESAEANTFAVTFQYMDLDAPFFGGNVLDLGNTGWGSEGKWQSASNKLGYRV